MSVIKRILLVVVKLIFLIELKDKSNNSRNNRYKKSLIKKIITFLIY